MFLEELEVNLTFEKYQWSHLPCRMALKPRRYPNVMRCIVGNTRDVWAGCKGVPLLTRQRSDVCWPCDNYRKQEDEEFCT